MGETLKDLSETGDFLALERVGVDAISETLWALTIGVKPVWAFGVA